MNTPDLTEVCPCCGQPLPAAPPDKSDPEALLRLLRTTTEVKERQVYKGRDNRWYVTYGGGQWAKTAVLALMARGAIRPVYSDPKAQAFHVGRTIDTAATYAARSRGEIKRTELIYVDTPA